MWSKRGITWESYDCRPYDDLGLLGVCLEGAGDPADPQADGEADDRGGGAGGGQQEEQGQGGQAEEQGAGSHPGGGTGSTCSL